MFSKRLHNNRASDCILDHVYICFHIPFTPIMKPFQLDSVLSILQRKYNFYRTHIPTTHHDNLEAVNTLFSDACLVREVLSQYAVDDVLEIIQQFTPELT